MNEILVINPRRKARKKTTRSKKRKVKKTTLQTFLKTKGVKTMARRRKTQKRRTYKAAAPAPVTRRRRSRRRSNPSRARKTASRAGRFARANIGGMNLKGALSNVPAAVIGMLAAKWSAKRFGENAATETDPESWSWAEYLKGSAGAFVAGFLAQMIKPGMGQRVLEGGLNLMVYKLVENELVPKSEWATAQFGQDATESAAIQYDEQGTPFLLGQDGSAYPVDERHRLPAMGDELQKPGYLGDELQKPGYLGGDAWQDAYFGATGSGVKANDPFAQAFFGRA